MVGTYEAMKSAIILKIISLSGPDLDFKYTIYALSVYVDEIDTTFDIGL